jgi:hypothetical protein
MLHGDTVIQNNCTLYSCLIEKGVYVGHNSVIMEGAILQRGAIIAPNSVVPPGRVVKERQVWGGNPIKYIRKALEQEAFVSFEYCRHSNDYGDIYKTAFLPYNNAYLYRHGPTEVPASLPSPSKRSSAWTSTNSTSPRPATTPPNPPSTGTTDISYLQLLMFMH